MHARCDEPYHGSRTERTQHASGEMASSLLQAARTLWSRRGPYPGLFMLNRHSGLCNRLFSKKAKQCDMVQELGCLRSIGRAAL